MGVFWGLLHRRRMGVFLGLLHRRRMSVFLGLLHRRGSAGRDVRGWLSDCSGSVKACTHRPGFGECDANHVAILTYLSDVR